MRTSKGTLLGLLTLIFSLSMQSVLMAADLWSYPLTPWNKDTISQHCTFRPGYGYHLGDDVYNTQYFPEYTQVKNARWGYVRFAGPATGYGNAVIIESPRKFESSTDPKKWKNPRCQVYGHLKNDSYLQAMKKKIGQTIDRGVIIGRLGNSAENGGYPVHLHYGIRKGNYSKTWVYWGYSSNKKELDNWEHPCDVISKY
jgi:hypothetical protein